MVNASIFHIPELTVPQLKPLQARSTRHLLAAKRCILGMAPGGGKTICAIAASDAASLYPAVVTCPPIVATKWAGEVLHWLDRRQSVSVLEGETPRPYRHDYARTICPDGSEALVPINDLDADVVIASYSIVYYWAREIAARRNRVLVADECHRLKDPTTLQSRAARYLATNLEEVAGTHYIFPLTGNIVVNRTSDLIEVLDIMGRLHEFGGRSGFERDYCGYKLVEHVSRSGRVYWRAEARGSSNSAELNRRLGRCMVRVTTEELMPELEPISTEIVPVELSNRDEFERAQADLLPYLEEIAAADRVFKAQLDAKTYFELTRDVGSRVADDLKRLAAPERVRVMRQVLRERRAQEASARARRAPALALLNTLRRLTAEGKAAPITEWLAGWREENPSDKYAMFADSRRLQHHLRLALPAAAAIDGDMTRGEKDYNIRRFETEDDCTDIVVSQKAGGECIDLVAARNAGVADLPFTSVTVDQCLRRSYGRQKNPHGLHAQIFLAPGTPDVRLLKIIERKKRMIDMLQDGVVGQSLVGASVEDELLDDLASAA